MGTKQAAYMVRKDGCFVGVFKPSNFPSDIKLESASPSKNYTVMELTGNHFNRFATELSDVAGFDILALDKTMRCGKHRGGLNCANAEPSEPQVIGVVKRDAVNKAVEAPTGDAASLGLRPTGHITANSNDVKARIQRENDLSDEEKKHRRSVCACFDVLFKKLHEVHATEEWVMHLKQRLPWMAGVPTLLRDQYNVAKVYSRLRSLSSVPLSPRGVIRGDVSSQHQGYWPGWRSE